MKTNLRLCPLQLFFQFSLFFLPCLLLCFKLGENRVTQVRQQVSGLLVCWKQISINVHLIGQKMDLWFVLGFITVHFHAVELQQLFFLFLHFNSVQSRNTNRCPRGLLVLLQCLTVIQDQLQQLRLFFWQLERKQDQRFSFILCVELQKDSTQQLQLLQPGEHHWCFIQSEIFLSDLNSCWIYSDNIYWHVQLVKNNNKNSFCL